MNTTRRTSAFVLLLLLGGMGSATSCMTSPAPHVAAMSPYGDRVTVTMSGGRHVSGEVLAVTDSSWVLMVGEKVTYVRPANIRDLYLKSFGFIKYSYGRSQPSESTLKQAREVARFPGGIPAQAMAELLAKSGQSAPEDLEQRPR